MNHKGEWGGSDELLMLDWLCQPSLRRLFYIIVITRWGKRGAELDPGDFRQD